MPPADQVLDALERILASDVFARSERARDLLRYLVEQDVAGNADRLKGFSIGVDVFRKDDQFDPATDTVVRVQAGRLRDLLQQYYEGDGAADPLRISVPRGSYVPEYHVADPTVACVASAATPEQDDVGKTANRRALPFLAIGLLLLAVLGGVAGYRSFAPPSPGNAGAQGVQRAAAPFGFSDTTGSVPGDLLPSVYMSVEAGDYGGERIAAAVRRGLSGFDTVHVIAPPMQPGKSGKVRRTDFLFLVGHASTPGEVHVELQNVSNGKVVLSRNLAIADRDQRAIEDIVADLLTTVASVSGVLYADLAENRAETPLARCLALNEAFYRDQQADAHRTAYECFEDLRKARVSSALIYAELAALHMQSIVNRYDYPEQASEQQALDYARRAVQLAPSSPSAHRAMGYVLSRTANLSEAMRWVHKAYALNEFDLSMAASYGYAQIFAGDYAAGTPILHRAVMAASAHPTWWDYGLFLGRFMLGEMEAASSAVSPLASSDRAHYLAARLVVAYELGDREKVDALLGRLRAGNSAFAANPEAFFRKGNYPESLTNRFVETLRAAGLMGAS
ncbi:tetratricopeptide repeat protein [Neoaquamicrobium sediminum]|uniref:tetratricopeptide repeat protein n=1 Tax=Neoaquamicrobium sediminum TaxID=1849104 RepID=UPI003BA97FCC